MKSVTKLYNSIILFTNSRMLRQKALIWVGIMLFTITSFFIACNEKPIEKDGELWAEVINFISPDTAYYPGLTKFPFPDLLRFQSLNNYFTYQNNAPIINDSAIIFYDRYYENDKRLCCKEDTLEIYTDTIGGKKYLFVFGEYLTVLQSNIFSDSNLRARKNSPSIPLWGIRLNTPYTAEKFKDEYEKLGTKLVQVNARFDEVNKQKWSENDSILVETIQFKNSNDRIITSVSKDMSANEVDSTVNYIKGNFPDLAYEESVETDPGGKPLKISKLSFQGITVLIKQVNATDYNFTITDYYETIRLILNNAGTSYIFRDDLSIY